MPGISLRIPALAACLVAAALVSPARGGDTSSDSLARRLQADLRDHTLNQFSLLEAALIAGGVTDSRELEGFRQQFELTCDTLAFRIDAEADDTLRINALLDGLHHDFLFGEYRSDYSQLHRTLSHGHFNCVTSTLLFRCLCVRFGVPCSAAAGKGHVLCQQVDRESNPIETTCRAWRMSADPRAPRPGQDDSRLTNLRGISDVQLLAKVYYNLGVEQLEQKRFADAVMLLEDACELDPGDLTARDNYLAAMNNWALAECDARQFEHASQLIVQGLQLDPTFPPLLTNDIHVHQKWAQSLCAEQSFERALNCMESCYERRADVKLFDHGRQAVCGLWAQAQLAAGDLAGAWHVLEQAARFAPDAATAREFEAETVLAVCKQLVNEGKPAAAARLLDASLQRQPRHPDLLRQKRDLPQVRS